MFDMQSLSIFKKNVVTSCGQSHNPGYTHIHRRLAPPTGTAIELVALSFEPQSNRCWAAQTVEVWTGSRAGKFPMICCCFEVSTMKIGVKLLCTSSISRHAVSLPSGSKLRCPTNEQPQKRPGDERNNNRWFMNQNLPDLNPPPEQMEPAYHIYACN